MNVLGGFGIVMGVVGLGIALVGLAIAVLARGWRREIAVPLAAVFPVGSPVVSSGCRFVAVAFRKLWVAMGFSFLSRPGT